MKRIFLFGMLFLMMTTLSGCFLFKKKCDCPSFGSVKKKVEHSNQPVATHAAIK